MNAKENPAAVNDGVRNQAGEPGVFVVPNSNADNTRRRLELGERAGKYLDGMCDAIASGRVELWQLPLSISCIYMLGYEQGRASRDGEIFVLNRECDYWYHRFANPRIPWLRRQELELWQVAS